MIKDRQTPFTKFFNAKKKRLKLIKDLTTERDRLFKQAVKARAEFVAIEDEIRSRSRSRKS